ncbi:MAG: hypothetical protein QXE51_01100 [Nitrososphaeria archaeon]
MKRIVITFVIISFIFSSVYAHVIGKFGLTYPIAEKDAYDEVLEKVYQKNLEQRFLSLRNKLTKHYTVNVPGIKKATRDKIKKVDLVYVLPFDIKDHQGKIIYPAGYKFNPLDYVRFPYTLLFFDATSPVELDWIIRSGFLERWDVIFVITKGDVLKTEESLGRQIYGASTYITKYFSIDKVPSILYQENNYLIVKEVGIYGNQTR